MSTTQFVYAFFSTLVIAIIVIAVCAILARIYIEVINYKAKRHHHFMKKCVQIAVMINEATDIGSLEEASHCFYFKMLSISEKERKENAVKLMEIAQMFRVKALLLEGDFMEAEKISNRVHADLILSKVR